MPNHTDADYRPNPRKIAYEEWSPMDLPAALLHNDFRRVDATKVRLEPSAGTGTPSEILRRALNNARSELKKQNISVVLLGSQSYDVETGALIPAPSKVPEVIEVKRPPNPNEIHGDVNSVKTEVEHFLRESAKLSAGQWVLHQKSEYRTNSDDVTKLVELLVLSFKLQATQLEVLKIEPSGTESIPGPFDSNIEKVIFTVDKTALLVSVKQNPFASPYILSPRS